MKQQTTTCSTCGSPAGEEGHLCSPGRLDGQLCDWCGALIPDQRHLCSEKVGRLAYICNSCGRTAVSADHLCQPKKIK